MSFLHQIAVTCRFIISRVADWLWSQIRTLAIHILFRHVFLASVLLPVYLFTCPPPVFESSNYMEQKHTRFPVRLNLIIIMNKGVHIIILVTPPLIMLRWEGYIRLRLQHHITKYTYMLLHSLIPGVLLNCMEIFSNALNHTDLIDPRYITLYCGNRMNKKTKDDIIRHILWPAMMQRYLTFEHFPQCFSS